MIKVKSGGHKRMHKKVKVAVIGAGTAGLYALSQVRKKTADFLLINSGPVGTTCARVGCMPSKTLIQAGNDSYRRHLFDALGIYGAEKLTVNKDDAMARVRQLRDSFVTGVIKSSIDPVRDRFIDGHARFREPGVLTVNGNTIEAEQIIIATGSRPVIPKAWQEFADKILTSDSLFEQESLPGKLAVIGLGSVGLELGQALSRLDVKVTGIDQLETLAGLQDPEVNNRAVEIFSREFPLWLGKAAEVQPENGRLRVSAGERNILVDKVLASLGRRPNIDDLGLENLDVALDENGIPAYDPRTMQVKNLPLFIAGDANRKNPILHEAADEGRIAGFNAVRHRVTSFRRKTNFTISFCDPNIAEVGTPFNDLERDGTAIGHYNLDSSGRATIMGVEQGLIRVYAKRDNGKLLGGSLLAPGAEHLAHLLAWAVQLQLTAGELLKMPYYHPTLEESLQRACNDLFTKTGPDEPGLKELERLA
jgi:dihydrolipoamide dehydrogenase